MRIDARIGDARRIRLANFAALPSSPLFPEEQAPHPDSFRTV
jgi:hypothetical protein